MHRVGPKGTVVIERSIRCELGVEPGWEVAQSLVGSDQVLLTFLPPRQAGAAFGFLSDVELSDEVREQLRTDEGLEEFIAAAARHHFEQKAARPKTE